MSDYPRKQSYEIDHERLRRIARGILESRERVRDLDENERTEIRQAILDAAHNATGYGVKYVVEGARVVCTSCLDLYPEDANGEDLENFVVSNSRMEKLVGIERLRRMEEEGISIIDVPPEGVGTVRAIASQVISATDAINAGQSGREFSNHDYAIDGSGSPTAISDVDINQNRLLDHLDIKFSPRFGEDVEDESIASAKGSPNKEMPSGKKVVKIGGANIGGLTATKMATLSHFNKNSDDDVEEVPQERVCKYSSCGRCIPLIEHDKWQGFEGEGDDKVRVDDLETLLTNNAYMFCTYGQGLLYITHDGQQLREEVFEPEVRNRIVNDNPHGHAIIKNRNITQIIMHHTGHILHNDGIWSAFNQFGEGSVPTGGYHELILRNGVVQTINEPDAIVWGVEGLTGIPARDRHNNRAAYQISLVGVGPNVSGGAEFPEIQKQAFIARARFWLNKLGLPLTSETFRGHYEIESTGCPGVDMDDVRDNWLG